jgi:hypothetical protein
MHPPTMALLLGLAAVTSAVSARAADEAPSPPVKIEEFLKPGETLAFRLSWGLISHAGETRIQTLLIEPGEQRHLKVRVTTRSRGVVNAIYPISNDTTSVFDLDTGRPLRLDIGGKEGDREIRANTVYDYENRQIVHTDEVRVHRSATLPMPDEPIYDLMVTVMQLREWRLKPGETRRVRCLANHEIYDLEVTATQVRSIRTPAGRFSAVEIVPRQLGEPKGFFRKGGSMHFWISQEDRPQLVRMDFRTKAGTITSSLVSVAELGAPDDADPGP